jgi:hypothetical protein
MVITLILTLLTLVPLITRAAIAQSIGVLGIDSRRGLGIFLFTIASRTALGPTQPPIQWVPGALSLVVKRPGREADHSPPSSAEVKEWLEVHIHSPSTPSCCGAQLKHRDNFTVSYCQIWRLNRSAAVNQQCCWHDVNQIDHPLVQSACFINVCDLFLKHQEVKYFYSLSLQMWGKVSFSSSFRATSDWPSHVTEVLFCWQQCVNSGNYETRNDRWQKLWKSASTLLSDDGSCRIC